MDYIFYMKQPPMTVVETPIFLRAAKSLLSDDERQELVAYLAEYPEKGVIIPDTGGVRKLRWARKGEGKSIGYRVIYYFHSKYIPLFVILIYGKNDKSNLTKEEKNTMKRLTAILTGYGSEVCQK